MKKFKEEKTVPVTTEAVPAMIVLQLGAHGVREATIKFKGLEGTRNFAERIVEGDPLFDVLVGPLDVQSAVNAYLEAKYPDAILEDLEEKPEPESKEDTP